MSAIKEDDTDIITARFGVQPKGTSSAARRIEAAGMKRRQESAVTMPKNKIERTSAGLRDALFDAMERVRDGDMPADDAKAFSGLAAQVCSTVQLEIQVAKLRTQYPADAKLLVPTPLQLGSPEEK